MPAVCKHTGFVGGFHDRIVVLLARGVGLLLIPCGQLVHRLYPGVAVLHGLNRLVARVVGFIQRIGKRAEALRRGGECIVECIRALRAARKRRVYAVQYALEGVVAVGHHLVFDPDRIPFVHQGLQARDLVIAQVAVLLFGKDRFNLFIDLVQPFNIAVQIADQIAARRFAQLGKAASDRVGVVRKAGNRRVQNFLRLRLAVRPCGDGGFQPVRHAVRAVHLEIVRAQLKRGQALRLFKCGRHILVPFLHGRVQSILRFARRLCAGYEICQRDGAHDHSCGNGKPYGWGFTQDGKKALPAAACFTYFCSKFSKGRRYRAHAFRDLAHYQQYGTGCSSIGRELNDLFPLGFVHGKEFLQKFFRAVDETANSGVQIVTYLLTKQESGIFQVLQLALRGSVALIRFFRQRSVLFPCVRSHILRP